MCSPKNIIPVPWGFGISLLTTFSVIRFEGADQTWYWKILGGYSEKFNLQFRSEYRGQKESPPGSIHGFQQNGCYRTLF